MKKNNGAFRWLVIGTGRIANTVMREVAAAGRHEVAAVFSRTQSKAQKFADKFGAKVFTSLDEAFASRSFDGAYIATPHSVHCKYILACVNAGVPVLSEKAFTVNRAQAEAALALAEEKKVYVCEGMWTRFNPVVKDICRWVREGKIGEIRSVSANFCLPVSVTKPFMSDRVYKPEYAGGSLLDLGVYPVAYAHMLLGSPTSLDCKMRLQDGVDYDCKITLKYDAPSPALAGGIPAKDGAACTLNCSFDGLKTYHSLIVGTKGEIRSNMFYKPTHAALYVDGKKVSSSRCKRGYIYEFDGVAEDIRAGKLQNELISHSDTLEVMRLLDLCRSQNDFTYPDNVEKI